MSDADADAHLQALRTLIAVSKRVHSSLDLTETLDAVAEGVVEAAGFGLACREPRRAERRLHRRLGGRQRAVAARHDGDQGQRGHLARAVPARGTLGQPLLRRPQVRRTGNPLHLGAGHPDPRGPGRLAPAGLPVRAAAGAQRRMDRRAQRRPARRRPPARPAAARGARPVRRARGHRDPARAHAFGAGAESGQPAVRGHPRPADRPGQPHLPAYAGGRPGARAGPRGRRAGDRPQRLQAGQRRCGTRGGRRGAAGDRRPDAPAHPRGRRAGPDRRRRVHRGPGRRQPGRRGCARPPSG